MSMVCSECGSEIPEGADFCYRCGARLDRALNVTEDGSGIISNHCFSCGGDIAPGDQFCQHCGKPVSASCIRLKRVKPSRLGILAILLSFLMGLVDVFGIGQIVLRRWAKGIAFLVISGVLFYLAPSFLATTTGTYVLLAIRLLVFFLQITDVFNAVYREGA